MAGRRKKIPTDTQLGGFKLIDEFRALLGPLNEKRVKSSRELDPRRKFDAEGYFTMMLFTLLGSRHRFHARALRHIPSQAL